jgi:hypothetical protein
VASLQVKTFTASTQADLEAQMNAWLLTVSIGAIADITTQALAVSTGSPKFYGTVVYQV